MNKYAEVGIGRVLRETDGLLLTLWLGGIARRGVGEILHG